MTQWSRSFGRLVTGIAYRTTSWSHPVSDFFAIFRSYRLWQRWKLLANGAPSDLANEVIGGVVCGDLVIDSYLRFRPSPSFDAHDPFLWRLLWQVLRDVGRARSYFRRERPKLYFTTYATYIDHGLAARVALQEGASVHVFSDLFNFGSGLTLSHLTQTPDCSGYRLAFNALPSEAQSHCLEQAETLISHRLAGGIDPATAYMRSSAYAHGEGNSAKLTSALQGSVVIFLHDFYDSPHVWPDLIFVDFWEWVCCTIETLDAASIPFFIKPHPNQISLSDVATAKLKAKYPNARWLDRSINNVGLARAPIACGVTVYGTIAHELAYLGVPSIGAASNPHVAFGFNRAARSRAEYAALLRDYAHRPLTNAEMKTQALQFYSIHNKLHEPEKVALAAAATNYYSASVAATGGADPARAIEALDGFRHQPAYARIIDEWARCANDPEKEGAAE